MTPAARYAAAIDVLDGFLEGEPAEKLLSNWARKNRYAGSKDRAAVRDIVFDGLRNLRGYAALSGVSGGRGVVIGQCSAQDTDLKDVFSGEGYAPAPLSEDEARQSDLPKKLSPAEAANLPDWIYRLFQDDLGEALSPTIAALNSRAPVDLRVNLSKTTREAAQVALLAEEIETETVAMVPTALRVTKNPRRVAGSKAFAQGLLELQDAASQSIVDLFDVAEGQSVLDYCAGGGGKTLAMAAKHPNARFDAWDISAARLAPLKERAKRAGAQVRLLSDAPTTVAYDVVVVDAPCSGAGSWRRNPEGKWRLTEDSLQQVQTMQSNVLDAACKTVKSGGTLVYITCSVLKSENQDQITAFCARSPEFSVLSEHCLNIGAPGDGFYCSILKKQL